MVSPARTKKANSSEPGQKGNIQQGGQRWGGPRAQRHPCVSPLLSPIPLPAPMRVAFVFLLVECFLQIVWELASSAPFSSPKEEEQPSPSPERPPVGPAWSHAQPSSPGVSRGVDGGKHAKQAKIVTSTVLCMAAIFKHGKLLVSE